MTNNLTRIRILHDVLSQRAERIRKYIEDLQSFEIHVKYEFAVHEIASSWNDGEDYEVSIDNARERLENDVNINGYIVLKPILATHNEHLSDLDISYLSGAGSWSSMTALHKPYESFIPLAANLTLPERDTAMLISAYKSECGSMINQMRQLMTCSHYLTTGLNNFNDQIYSLAILAGSDNWRLNKSIDVVLSIVENLQAELYIPGLPEPKTYFVNDPKTTNKIAQLDWNMLCDWAVKENTYDTGINML